MIDAMKAHIETDPADAEALPGLDSVDGSPDEYSVTATISEVGHVEQFRHGSLTVSAGDTHDHGVDYGHIRAAHDDDRGLGTIVRMLRPESDRIVQRADQVVPAAFGGEIARFSGVRSVDWDGRNTILVFPNGDAGMIPRSWIKTVSDNRVVP